MESLIDAALPSVIQILSELASVPPFPPRSGGVTLTLVVVFLLGFLATRAEPALNVLGRTAEKVSLGAFKRSTLVYSVCVGVAVGMVTGAWPQQLLALCRRLDRGVLRFVQRISVIMHTSLARYSSPTTGSGKLMLAPVSMVTRCASVISAGAAKILFGVSLIYWILAKYAVACALTYFATEDFTNIAWDSAGELAAMFTFCWFPQAVVNLVVNVRIRAVTKLFKQLDQLFLRQCQYPCTAVLL